MRLRNNKSCRHTPKHHARSMQREPREVVHHQQRHARHHQRNGGRARKTQAVGKRKPKQHPEGEFEHDRMGEEGNRGRQWQERSDGDRGGKQHGGDQYRGPARSHSVIANRKEKNISSWSVQPCPTTGCRMPSGRGQG